ncbi:MAG TPA: SUMF1/EgtB/PvdO family nonheme iron enzyme [Pyrinomonadaceae bacterium]|nr:SUMF1/EgtB/PvdO family nonheme iron enzyme [Pyrinomonadaceae bacterium]
MKTTRDSRKRGVAAVLCLAVVGSLYAINSSRPKATNAVEASFVCDSGKASPHNHAAHTGDSVDEGDSLGVSEAAVIDTVNAPAPAPEGMVWIPGGEFSMGSEDAEMRDARPFHRVAIDGFWMDQTEVTNAEFARFVKATGYVTVAERTPDAKDFPDAPPENLVAGSVVFTPPDQKVSLDDHFAWWRYVPGANWRHPDGPESNLKNKEKHPVTVIRLAKAA